MLLHGEHQGKDIMQIFARMGINDKSLAKNFCKTHPQNLENVGAIFLSSHPFP